MQEPLALPVATHRMSIEFVIAALQKTIVHFKLFKYFIPASVT
mgnify:CR=1 FL=1